MPAGGASGLGTTVQILARADDDLFLAACVCEPELPPKSRAAQPTIRPH